MGIFGQIKLFLEKMPCILHYNAKKIRNTISRLVRDLAQKAKWPIQEKENPGPSNHFEQLVSKVSYSYTNVMSAKNHSVEQMC